MDEATIREYVQQYDFLIAEGIPCRQLHAKNVYDHYDKAPELHVEDLGIFLDIIKEKYPEISDSAEQFLQGKTFYPCNMFIMSKELFREYSAMLFDILDEFEKRADMSLYSREGYRTTGHLGERMVGIFYEYLQKKGGYRLGELQIALIQNADAQPQVVVPKGDRVIPMVLAANQKYVPIMYNCAQSIVNHTTESYQYEIYVFHTDITADSQKIFHDELERENVHFTFINVLEKVTGYRLQAKEHITTETFYRFLILDILKGYKKVLYLDCDMIIMRDVADLYSIDLGENLIGAAKDPDFMGQCNGANTDTKEYCEEVLKINPYEYFQAGVLLLNVEELNRTTTVEKLLQMADTGIYKYSDQDILNIVCEHKVTYIDMAWNMIVDCDHFRWHGVIKYAPYYILDEYEEARKHPYIIHYAGFLKPWMKADEDFAEEFWKIARTNRYYEVILSDMNVKTASDIAYAVTAKSRRFHDKRVQFLERTKVRLKKILPKGSGIREFACKVYWKIK
jgi:lipopolysaccharide biosynthesis glycosyltransferase